MHTLHWFAVEAQDREEAFDLVQSRLSSEDGDKFVEWSDWHVVGGGRWSDSQYADSPDMIMSYQEDPSAFRIRLAAIKKGRIAEMNRLLEQLKPDKLMSDIVDYISNDCVMSNELRFGDLNGYYFKQAADMLMDYYTPDSYFYDLVEYTAHIGYIGQRLDDPDTAMRQYLVPVDFHF